tara:strand:- start:2963 stop:3865 length:903 start_codon:yes stop_codon:yes gene_type:complete
MTEENAQVEAPTEEVVETQTEETVPESAEAGAVETPAEEEYTQQQIDQYRSEIAAEKKKLRSQYGKVGAKSDQLKKRESDLQAKEADLQSWGSLQEVIKSGNKSQLLSHLGISIDDITAEIVSGALVEEETPTYGIDPAQQARIDKLEAKLQSWEDDKTARANEKSGNEIVKVLSEAISGSDAELLKSKGSEAVTQVYSIINETFTATGEAPMIADVIAELEATYKQEAESFFETPYAKKLLDDRYDEYLKTKAEERKKSPISNRVSTSRNPSVAKEGDIPGKGTAEGLKHLMKKNPIFK